jgi:ABC-type branched-subunit amino acid transport system permease subunit
MMAVGLNVVVGYAGLLDLGYVAFYAIGAYTRGLARLAAVRAGAVPLRRRRDRATTPASTSRSGSCS